MKTEEKIKFLEAQVEELKAKFDHFINPSTKPQSIDDATVREWDLCVSNAKLRAQIAEATKDKERLDWLAALDCDSHLWDELRDTTTIRQAIDAAIEAQKK